MKDLRFSAVPRVAIGLLFCALSATGASAATTAADSAAAIYERERAACISGQSHQNLTTCLREAAAARAEAGQRGAGPDEATLQANRIKRCAPLPEAERRDCELRMSGAGTQSGSVAGGGIYRELVTREPAIPIAPTAPTAPATPALPASPGK